MKSIYQKFFLLILTSFIFTVNSIQCMKREREFSEEKLRHKKQKPELKQFPLINFPKEMFVNIFNNSDDKVKNLCDHIKFFLTLRSTGKYFNEFLTTEQISQSCILYDQRTKDITLSHLVRKMNDEKNYEKLHFPFLILMCAKANPNKILSYFPTFFYAKITKCAQLLIDNGADIHLKDRDDKTNVLWHLINGYAFLEKDRLDLFQFYIEKGVDLKALRPRDNACLFHCLNGKFQAFQEQYNYEKTKFAEILFTKIPDMINKLTVYYQTSLDLAIHLQKHYNYLLDNCFKKDASKIKLELEKLENYIAFLRNRGAKTAQEFKSQT